MDKGAWKALQPTRLQRFGHNLESKQQQEED